MVCGKREHKLRIVINIKATKQKNEKAKKLLEEVDNLVLCLLATENKKEKEIKSQISE